MEIVSIAPEATDTIVLMNHNDLIKATLRNAISTAWHWGILVEAELGGDTGEVVHKFQVNGNPWSSKDEELLKAKKLLLEIIVQMDQIGYRLLATVNIEVIKTFSNIITLEKYCQEIKNGSGSKPQIQNAKFHILQ